MLLILMAGLPLTAESVFPMISEVVLLFSTIRPPKEHFFIILFVISFAQILCSVNLIPDLEQLLILLFTMPDREERSYITIPFLDIFLIEFPVIEISELCLSTRIPSLYLAYGSFFENFAPLMEFPAISQFLASDMVMPSPAVMIVLSRIDIELI